MMGECSNDDAEIASLAHPAANHMEYQVEVLMWRKVSSTQSTTEQAFRVVRLTVKPGGDKRRQLFVRPA
jgi:hypothetical protein